MASTLGFSMIQDNNEDLKPIYNNSTDNTVESNKITVDTIKSIQHDMTTPDPVRKNNNEDEEITDEQLPQTKHEEGFDNISPLETSYDIQSKYNEQYENSMYQENSLSSKSESDELLTKLNYMIHLLEEQQEQKTGHVLEEIILYCFLGVFIIFTIDSFAKVGKYTR